MSVTVIGDAFIDLIVPIHGTKRGETYHRKIVVSCGGTASVAVQISRLGEKAKFMGKVGDDVFRAYFKQNLKVNGVEDLTIVDEEYPTGICISLVYEDGERTMIASRGANDFLKREEIEERIEEILDSKIVYFSGYSLVSRQTAEAVLYGIKESYESCEIYFNPGASNLINKKFREVVRDFVDVLIMSQEEVKAMTGGNSLNDTLEVLKEMVSLAVITMGEKGCIISKGGETFHIEGERINALDTTGAGDSFAAGFIVGKLRGLDDIKCAKLGNETAIKFLKEKMKVFK